MKLLHVMGAKLIKYVIYAGNALFVMILIYAVHVIIIILMTVVMHSKELMCQMQSKSIMFVKLMKGFNYS